MQGRIAAALSLVLLAGACGHADEAAERSPGNFVPPVTRAPDPLPGQRQSTPLASYVGHYPNDAVDGVTFFDRTEVAGLLVDAVPDESIRRLIVGRDATVVPIAQIDDRIAAHGCEAHNCGDHDWTVLVSPDGNRDAGAVCYHDAATMRNASRWTTRGDTAMRPGDCPQV